MTLLKREQLVNVELNLVKSGANFKLVVKGDTGEVQRAVEILAPHVRYMTYNFGRRGG